MWSYERWKIVRRCGAKQISKSKCTKHTDIGSLLEVEMSKKCTPLWREALFQVKMLTAPHARTTLKVQMWVCVAGARDSAPCRTWANEGFVAFPRTMAGVGHLKRICKDACRVAGAVPNTCASEMFGGQGADFLRRVAFWNIRSSGSLRWFCDLASLFPGRRNTLDKWNGKNAKRSGTRPSALHATSHFWRKSRGIASFLMLEKWGSLAELLRFWCCQLQKSRKSRRIASFLTLPSSKVEDVSQNSFVFKLADRQIDSYNYNILQLHYATQPNTTLPYSYSHSHD